MDSKETRCLVFDLDGTLSDTLPDLVSALNRMRAEFELPALFPDNIKPLLDLGLHDLLRRSLKGSEVTAEEAEEAFLENYRNALNDRSGLYPGVFQGLRDLKTAGWRLRVFRPVSARPV